MHDGQLGFAILEQKASVTAENRAFEEKQPLVFLPKAAIMVVWKVWSATKCGAGGGGGEREVKIRRHRIPRIGRAHKEN